MSLTHCAYLPPGPANLTEKLFCHGHMGTITLYQSLMFPGPLHPWLSVKPRTRRERTKGHWK
jgi:hypothetical protein